MGDKNRGFKMHYDYDVCVIGGGLAGMSAAIRTRWVKSYKAVCCSTAILESSRLGGLAGWKSTLLTGPSFKFIGEELIGKLVEDIRKFNIPVINDRVVKINATDEIKVITTARGKEIRALSLIIATGFKSLSNEYKYLDKGLKITYMGYEFIEKTFSELFRNNFDRTILIIGNEKVFNLRRIIEVGNRNRIKYIIDLRKGAAIPQDIKNEIIFGKVIRYFGEDRLEGVVISREDREERIRCDIAILDYNSYEIHPCFDIINSDMRRDERGFIQIDREMCTNLPGIFAAGDISGLYASSAKSIAEGIIAGFSAYSYVFSKKFGRRPSLFAYEPTDFLIPIGFKELPVLNLALKPKLISSRLMMENSLETFEGTDSLTSRVELIALFDGFTTVEDLLENSTLDREEFLNLLYYLLEEKIITVHK